MLGSAPTSAGRSTRHRWRPTGRRSRFMLPMPGGSPDEIHLRMGTAHEEVDGRSPTEATRPKGSAMRTAGPWRDEFSAGGVRGWTPRGDKQERPEEKSCKLKSRS